MKILCVADHVDPLVYSYSIKERFKDVDLVLSAGDLPMDYLGYIVSTLNKPLFFVFGNHNLKHLHFFNKRFDNRMFHEDSVLEKTFGATFVGFKVFRSKRHDLIIVGLGGSIKYNKGDNQYSQLGMYLKIFGLIPKLIFNKIVYGRFLDILLTHSAPRGINDRNDPCHIGFESFKWFMRKFKPEYLLHGHIHLYDHNSKREAFYYKTKIINVYDHYVLNYKKGDNIGQ